MSDNQELPGEPKEGVDGPLSGKLLVVNNEPFCIWAPDHRTRNLEFLRRMDFEYFPFLVETFLAANDEKRAALGLRTAFHHSLEALFSMLGAYVQAPDCVYGWLGKCSTPNLREVTKRIADKDPGLFTRWRPRLEGWTGVAKSVLRNYLPGTEKQEKTIEMFGTLWARLAHEFLHQDHVDEYNSIKHGLRIGQGGFKLEFGTPAVDGSPPKDSEMHSLGGSEHGSSFFRLQKIGDTESRSIRPRRVHVNWQIERVALLTQLAGTSLQNLVASLRILNGEKSGTVQFFRPIEDEDFERAWKVSVGAVSMNFDFSLDPSEIPVLRKEDLVERMRSLPE